MKPIGGAASATNTDREKNRVTGDYREYKCDSCGYPEGGQAKVVQVSEKERIVESLNTSRNNNNNNSSNSDHKNNQPF